MHCINKLYWNYFLKALEDQWQILTINKTMSTLFKPQRMWIDTFQWIYINTLTLYQPKDSTVYFTFAKWINKTTCWLSLCILCNVHCCIMDWRWIHFERISKSNKSRFSYKINKIMLTFPLHPCNVAIMDCQLCKLTIENEKDVLLLLQSSCSLHFSK